MFEKICIFNFDGTLTIRKSFGETHRDKFPQNEEDAIEAYQEGVQYAINRKSGLDSYFHHNITTISCIVTYRNNPNFIAGFVSAILGKNLILSHTKKDKLIAVNYYHITGLPNFLIAYIPFSGLPITEGLGSPEYQAVIDQLSGKNNHIEVLLEIFKFDFRIREDAPIHFYDDDPRHFHKAGLLQIHAHLVNSRKREFTLVETFAPGGLIELVEALKRDNADLRDKVGQLDCQLALYRQLYDLSDIDTSNAPTFPQYKSMLQLYDGEDSHEQEEKKEERLAINNLVRTQSTARLYLPASTAASPSSNTQGLSYPNKRKTKAHASKPGLFALPLSSKRDVKRDELSPLASKQDIKKLRVQNTRQEDPDDHQAQSSAIIII